MKVCFVVSELPFFLSHRLDLAETIAKDYEFFLVTDAFKATKGEINNLTKNKITFYIIGNVTDSRIFSSLLSLTAQVKIKKNLIS